MITTMRHRIGRRLARVLGSNDETGMALATVIIFGTVLLLMSATVVSVSVSGNTKSQSDTNWVAAGQAAYAGVEDYQSKLANDNGYAQYGAFGNPFSASSTFNYGTDGNLAFGWGPTNSTTGTWQTVDPDDLSKLPDGTVKNPNGPAYRYAVDNSQYPKTGVLLLQSTGRVGNVTRTVVANLKQSGFLDYLYFTDDEFPDPLVEPDCPKGTTNTYQWNTTLTGNCSAIQFVAGDTISGPVHSNDTLSVCGSTFLNTVSTSAPVAKVSKGYVVPSGCSLKPNPTTFAPTYTPIIQMPSTITQLSQETRTDLDSVRNPGCLYTGPTTFTFNADGTWTVYSPWTQYTNFTGVIPNAKGDNSLSAQCGTAGYSSKGNTLGSPGGQKFTVLDNNVAYVQSVPTNSTDPNYPSSSWSGGLPPSYACTGVDTSVAGNGVGFPANGETAPTNAYGCKNGDAFVKGTVNGHVTIGAANYAYITGDIVYNNPGDDILGLIGQNNVYVYNPVKTVKSGNSSSLQLMDRSKPNRVIDAAIMSVAHSFTVENYTADTNYPDGKLTVLGSIVQKYRGAVGTSQSGTIVTGFVKDYRYDPRLAFQAPPKFLSPVSTSYGITSVTEVKTAFNSKGMTP